MSLSDDLKAWIDTVDRDHSDALTRLADHSAAIDQIHNDLTTIEANVQRLADVVNKAGVSATEMAASLSLVIAHLAELESRVDVLDDPFKPEEPKEPVEPPIDPTEPVDPTPLPPTPPVIPSDAVVIPLYVRESASVSRSRAFVSTGIPIAEDLNVTDLSHLVLLDYQGFPIAADFRPTAYWRTAKSSNGIQWVQVSFFDKFGAMEEKQYRLVISKEKWMEPAPKQIEADKAIFAIAISTEGHRWYVNGGGIDIHDKNGQLICEGQVSNIYFDGKTGSANGKVRRLEIEYAGPLVCYIQVETETDLKFGDQLTTRPAIGKDPATLKPIYPLGSIVISRRYEFRAGSGTVVCQQTIKWEGTKNGTNWLDKDGVKVNGVLGELWQDTFKLSAKPTDIRAIASKSATYEDIEGTAVKITQTLRQNRTKSRIATLETDGSVIDSILAANKGLLVLSYPGSDLVFGLAHMDLYEPQSLSYDPATSSISVSYASDKFWLAHHQGVSVRSVIALEDESRLDEVWAELNHPLRIFALDSAYYSVSGYGPVPVNHLGQTPTTPATPTTTPTAVGYDYYTAIKSICDSTLFNIDRFGLYGLQTYIGLPRYWGKNDGGDEVGAVSRNQAVNWDDAYKWGAWTDYYSSSRTAVTLALLSGDSTYLDLISIPSADRMLHTQIFCGSPDDKYTHIGWAPAGYNAYRSDLNSSHSYYENLYWYYFLTGDRQVVDILSRGEDYFVTTLKTYPLGGRHANQHIMCQRFLSHAHYDDTKAAKYGLSFESLALKAINDCYIEGTYNGELASFWIDGYVTNIDSTGKVSIQYGKLTGPSRYVTLNHYASAIWDFDSLYQFSLDYPQHAERVNHILTTLAKTLQKYGPLTVAGDGTVSGDWSRSFLFTWNGLAGSSSLITNLVNKPEPGEAKPLLYPFDKPGMVAWWARAAKISGDVEMKRRSEELIKFAIDGIIRSKLPMGKEMGLAECRLMAAVGTL